MGYGITLNQYNSAPACSPSRAQLMTGKYASAVGIQNLVIPKPCPYGVGLEEKLLPQYLKEGGYSTYMIGKWHLGFFEENYAPHKRGFDSFFGYLGDYLDYFNQSSYHDVNL